MTRSERMNRNLVHLIREYGRKNWSAELLHSLTEGDAYIVRNQAHRFVTKPDHPENAMILRRLLPGTPMRDGKYAPDLEPNVDPA